MTENEAIKRMRYRIDTATDVIGKGVDGRAYEDMKIAIKALEEIQKYKEIGTVGECWEAMERQILKKPVIWANGSEHCPNENCEKDISQIGISNYCSDCGQKLDWSKWMQKFREKGYRK